MTDGWIMDAAHEALDEMSKCYSCGGEWDEYKCEEAKRACGHHCNHIIDDGPCHWCAAEYCPACLLSGDGENPNCHRCEGTGLVWEKK